MKLSIVIPAYNEEKRLPAMLSAYAKFYTERLGDEVELIVVVNGTTDRTVEVIEQLVETYSQIRVLEEPDPIGKGGGIKLGVAEASGEWIGYVDADGATPPKAFWDLYEKRLDQHVMIASRWLKESKMEPPQPLRRRISSRCFNVLVNTLFNFGLRDTQCGAKLVQGKAFKSILLSLNLTRWAFDVDFLFHLKRSGSFFKEIPTVWRDVEGSKVRYLRSSADMFLAVLRLRLLYSPFGWIVTVYNKFYKLVT